MDQKLLGIMMLAVGAFLVISVYSYTSEIAALGAELHKNCDMSDAVCPYKRGAPIESYHGYFLSAMVVIAGAYMGFFQKKAEKVVVEKPTAVDRSKTRKAMESLVGDEKQVFHMLSGSDGAMFQSDIMQKTGFSKVKTSRILDRLELKGLAERRRRGMANLVVLKV